MSWTSWIGISLSGDQTKTNEVATLSGKVCVLVDSCFLATNKLIDCIQKHIPGQKFDKVERNAPISIPDDCDIILQSLGEVESYLENKKIDVAKEMNPEQFKKLVSTDASFMQKMAIARTSSTTIIDIVGSVEGVFVCGAINAGTEFANIRRVLGNMKSCAPPTVYSGVLSHLWRMIDCARGAPVVYGHESDLNEYHRVVQTFQPAADEFYDNISSVIAIIEMTE